MKTKLFLTLALSLLGSWNLHAIATNNLTGNWQGTLDAGAAKLRLVFKITQAADGKLTASMDSPDQGVRDIRVESVSANDMKLRMEVKSVRGVYEGNLNATRTKVTGHWSQGGGDFPLTLEKGQGNGLAAEAEKLSSTDQAANKLAAMKLVGTWDGALSAGPAILRLRVHISKTAAGAATGTIDSLDQGANDIPLSAITLKDDKVRFEARGIGGVYEGNLATDGASFAGQWQQGGKSLPLELKKPAATVR
jgi:hypothetical protein